jgi:hypothetical protein
MKKIFMLMIVFTATSFIVNKAAAQVRFNVNVGLGVPVYAVPPPPPPAVVYDDDYYPPTTVIVEHHSRPVVVREEHCYPAYGYGRRYDYDDYRYREYPGRRVGWYKNHGGYEEHERREHMYRGDRD